MVNVQRSSSRSGGGRCGARLMGEQALTDPVSPKDVKR